MTFKVCFRRAEGVRVTTLLSLLSLVCLVFKIFLCSLYGRGYIMNSIFFFSQTPSQIAYFAQRVRTMHILANIITGSVSKLILSLINNILIQIWQYVMYTRYRFITLIHKLICDFSTVTQIQTFIRIPYS